MHGEGGDVALEPRWLRHHEGVRPMVEPADEAVQDSPGSSPRLEAPEGAVVENEGDPDNSSIAWRSGGGFRRFRCDTAILGGGAGNRLRRPVKEEDAVADGRKIRFTVTGMT